MYEGALQFPVDLATITGIAITGTEGVTHVDPASVEIVWAAGEAWLRWDHNGFRRSVNVRHIAEVYSKSPVINVIDLTDTASDYSRLRAVHGLME